jgi:transcriptional regulator with PAS, ATPase and Fis domain
MPLQRITANELGRLLNSAKEPIYVLDDDLTIVFLNRACQEWLGEAADGLLGRRCAYHSSPAVAGPDAVAARLCPPPQAPAGGVFTATVSRLAEDGAIVERRARFLPLGLGGDDFFGIVAIVEAADKRLEGEAPAPETTPSEAVALHEYVGRFRQEAASRYRADRLIGQGPAMRLARRQVELATASRASVLLVGPAGSGRQHLAAAIHYGADRSVGATVALSPRAGSTTATPTTVRVAGLTPLDCSLLGEDLLEAATAAVAHETKTLLLHRVDELSSDAQVQLAEFLARRPPPGKGDSPHLPERPEGCLAQMGTVPCSRLRLIATATEPLGELARRGNFRADLAALLSTITIELPPLVERRDDLPLLAQMFLEEHNAAGPRQIGGFSPAAMDRLDAYAWPGNLDELAQVVADAYARAGGPEIGVEDLPERLRAAAQAAAVPRRVDETIVLDEYLGRVERELIRRAIARAKGNKARAARLLGVTRPRLYRRMVQLGLE